RASALERAGHPEMVGMEMRDEHTADVGKVDPRVREPGAQDGLRLRGVQPGVDERVASGALDEVGVHAAERERERKLDAPDAGRDDVRAQRRSFARVITATMVILRPVRLAAQDTALSRQRPAVRIRYGLPVRSRLCSRRVRHHAYATGPEVSLPGPLGPA